MQTHPLPAQSYPVVSGNPKDQAEARYRANTGLIGAALKRFHGLPPDQWEDALQNARLGLFHAARRFDPALGRAFSTFATACVRGYILRGLMRERDQARLPCVSLSMPLGEDEGAGTFGDLLPADHCPIAEMIDQAAFTARLSGLPARWQHVLRAIYEDERTLQSVADEWDCSRAAAHSQFQRGLRRLREDYIREEAILKEPTL